MVAGILKKNESQGNGTPMRQRNDDSLIFVAPNQTTRPTLRYRNKHAMIST
jgi:hypothetical protein